MSEQDRQQAGAVAPAVHPPPRSMGALTSLAFSSAYQLAARVGHAPGDPVDARAAQR